MKKGTTNEEKFLYGLTKLTLKYGIVIGGCGCCCSPYFSEEKPEDLTGGEYTYGYQLSFNKVKK